MTELNGAVLPTLTIDERSAFKDLWDVYDRHFDSISAATLKVVEADPDLRQLAHSRDRADMDREQERSRALMRQALVEGSWQPFLDNIKEQGGHYARAGLPFSAWFVIVTGAQTEIVERLFDAYGTEPVRLRAVLGALNKLFFDITLATIGQEYLNTREIVIGKQQEAIKELSTPVLPLRPGLILLPVIGVLDTSRARQLTEHLLDGIRAHRAKVVVMDLTGVPIVDSAVANHLLQTIRAARLLGAHSVVTGISTDNAQILTRIGVDLSHLVTTSDLQGGIEEAEWILDSVRTRPEPTVASLAAGPVS